VYYSNFQRECTGGRKNNFYFQYRISVLLIIFVCAAITEPAHAAQAPSMCVQLIGTPSFTQKITTSIYTLNMQTGLLKQDNRPTIVPSALLSPDGKYAAFMQTTIFQKTGLYMASRASNQAVLLHEYDGEEVRSYNALFPFAWSPNGLNLGYITAENGELWLNIANRQTGKTRRTAIAPGQDSENVMFTGWSGDGQYLAATLGKSELSIWFAPNLTRKPITFSEVPTDQYFPAAWSPVGHQIVFVVSQQPLRLMVWSPDSAKPATIDLQDYDLLGYEGGEVDYNLFWSPDGKGIKLESYGESDYNDEAIAFDGKTLIQAPESQNFRYLIGWLPNGSAMLLDEPYESSNNLPTRLYSLNIRQQVSQTIDTNVDLPYSQSGVNLAVSPSGANFVFFSQKQGVTSAYIASMDGKRVSPIWSDPWFNLVFEAYPEASWSPSGKYAVVYVPYYIRPDRVPPQPSYNLLFDETLIRRVSDGQQQMVLGPIYWISDDWIAYSQWVTNSNNLGNYLTSNMNIMNLETGETQVIGSRSSPDFYDPIFALSSDGTILAGVVDAKDLGLDGNELELIFLHQHQPIIRVPLTQLNTDGLSYNADRQDSTKYVLAWSPDSSALAYIDGNNLIVINREGALLRTVPVTVDPTAALRWINCS
jgi:Tol biopolymer transport system component